MSSLFTFGNIGTATDGQPVSTVSEVRQPLGLRPRYPPPMVAHYTTSERSERMSSSPVKKVSTAQLGTAQEKKASAASGTVSRTPLGG